MPTPSKKAKSMPNYDVHAKHHFFMPNHFKKGQISGIRPWKCQPGNPGNEIKIVGISFAASPWARTLTECFL